MGGTLGTRNPRAHPRHRREGGAPRAPKTAGSRITFSHLVMGGIMMMYFTGGLLGAYATVSLGEPVATTLDYILELAKIVGLGYFVKAFGENIAKIILSAVYGAQFPTAAVAVSNEIVEEGEEENGSA